LEALNIADSNGQKQMKKVPSHRFPLLSNTLILNVDIDTFSAFWLLEKSEGVL
jgi:hypothetical protein